MIPQGRGHIDRRTVSALLDGELDLRVVRESRLHLARCEVCREILQQMAEVDCRVALSRGRGRPRPGFLEGLLEVIGQREAEENPERSPVRRRRMLLSVAGVAALLLVGLTAFAVLSPLPTERSSRPSVISIAPSGTAVEAEQEPAPALVRVPPAEATRPRPAQPALPPPPHARVKPAPPALEMVVVVRQGPPAEPSVPRTAVVSEAALGVDVELAMNPIPGRLVHREVAGTPAEGESPPHDAAAQEALRWPALAAISRDLYIGREKHPRIRERQPMARDHPPQWKGGSEELGDYVASFLITVARN